MTNEILFAPIENQGPPSKPENQIYNLENVIMFRLNMCENCQHVTSKRSCSLCGCPINMLAQFNFKTCPKEYW